MVEVLDWRGASDRSAMAAVLAQALEAGRLVGLPTGTGYALAACALAPAAVERLGEMNGGHLLLAVKDAAEAADWWPSLSAAGRRLTRRCWPGPVRFVSGDGLDDGVAGRLPESVRQRVAPHGEVELTAPAHEGLALALSRLAGPLVLAPVAGANGGEAAFAQAVHEAAGDRLDVLLDDGPCREPHGATVVRLAGPAWQVVREGAVSAEELARMAATVIVFVCTGNTCRSPLAEGLCKKLLADQLGCTAAELPRRGFIVLSAGLAAMMGGRAAQEAVEVARDYGADLSGHASRPLTADLAREADFLVVMTGSHRLALEGGAGVPGLRPRLLCPDGGDVPDPIGSDQEVYRDCAGRIPAHLERLLPEVLHA